MEITAEIVRELLDYDPDTGIFTWRVRGREWFSCEKSWRLWNSRYSGKRAGSVSSGKTGYKRRYIDIFSIPRLEHILAWMWMTDSPVPDRIDHDNRDATDNRWANIRESDPSRNSRNLSMMSNNKSGVTGVIWHKRAKKWMASAKLKGKSIYLGLFEEIDEAAMAVLEFRADNGFHKGHGLELAHYHAAPNT